MAEPVIFQKFLLRLSKEFSPENIQEIKFLLLPDEHEDEPSTGVELLRRLQKHGKLSENNVEGFISLLRDIDRDDLAEKVKEYKVKNINQGPIGVGASVANVNVAMSQFSNATRQQVSTPMAVEHDEGVHNTTLENATENTYNTYASENLSTGFVLESDSQSTNENVTVAAYDGNIMDEPKSSYFDENQVKDLSISTIGSNAEILYLQGPMDQSITAATSLANVEAFGSDYHNDQVRESSSSIVSSNAEIPAVYDGALMDEPESSEPPLSTPMDIEQESRVLNNAEVELHNYQKWLASPSLKKSNTIICCPTGSGKTLTAAHICYELRKEAMILNKEKAFKTVFIVPTRNLKQQQMDNFDMMPFEPNTLEVLDDMADVLDVIKARDIVFMTAKVLVNALEYTRLEITDLDLIIMDECHHTDKGHPYNELMQNFYLVEKARQVDQRGSLPQILGLTATLGVGKGARPIEHCIKMCANLDCLTVTHLTKEEHLTELKLHRPPLKADEIRAVPSRSSRDPFLLLLHDLMDHICEKYGLSCEHAEGSQGYETWTVETRNNAESAQNWERAAAASFLKMYTNAIECTYNLRRRDGLRLIKNKLIELCPKGQTEQPWEVELQRSLDEKMDLLIELCDDKRDENPMGTDLANLLIKLIGNPDAKGLILTRTKYSTQALLEFINESAIPNVRVGRIIGQGQGSSQDSQTDKRQLKVLEDFRNGTINVLVGTDVVQEGLDVPRCNFVIRYNFVSNEIGSVQGKGRARHVDSVCYLIVPKGSINEARERENTLKVELMKEALKELDREKRDILEEKIRNKQKENWDEYLLKQREKRTRVYDITPDAVTLFHKGECGVELCKGSDIIRKGTDYICIAPSFINDKIKESPVWRQNFRYDSLIGAIECKKCGKKLGSLKEYKFGGRRKGHILANKSVMYSVNGKKTLEHIKQWSKVGWQIQEEPLD
ncbi:unnamed protein product [Owenia fusiformis]|uniref:RNA helicase n=1 Tax=Owenia fusiformis TaxID=6347 RepID=A0A8J1TRI8_OWEFU|nr:unnamed protein product [Owenia fusiformis]